jgi:hypothetical protein
VVLEFWIRGFAGWLPLPEMMPVATGYHTISGDDPFILVLDGTNESGVVSLVLRNAFKLMTRDANARATAD